MAPKSTSLVDGITQPKHHLNGAALHKITEVDHALVDEDDNFGFNELYSEFTDESHETQPQDKTSKFDGIEDALDVKTDIVPVETTAPVPVEPPLYKGTVEERL